MVNIFSYKESLDKIWAKAEGLNEKSSRIISRGYCIERHLPKNSILFLGMNPSYDGKKDAGHQYFFYDFNNPDDDNIKAHQQYWKRMQDTACKLNVKLCHHDLFSVRETTQNKIIGLRSDPAFKGFFNDQLSLTLQIIKEAEPEIIVAINAGVRDIICSEKLFGSMISGQRALDRGSYNSLLWHIRHIRRSITQSDCSSYKPERPESPIIDDKPSIHSASTVVRYPCRYVFDGSKIKTYGELSFNIIKRFLIDNPHLTFQTIKNVLPEDARITRLKDLDEKKEKSMTVCSLSFQRAGHIMGNIRMTSAR